MGQNLSGKNLWQLEPRSEWPVSFPVSLPGQEGFTAAYWEASKFVPRGWLALEQDEVSDVF